MNIGARRKLWIGRALSLQVAGIVRFEAVMLRTTIAATLLLAAPAAHAAEPTAQTALTRFCEPLIAGSSAAAVKQAARAEGFADQVVPGSR